MDIANFYKNIKLNGLFNTLTDKQVEGIDALIKEAADMPINQLAYLLATVKWETANTMQPIEEIGKGRGRRYGQRVWFNGTPYTDVTYIYYGRGFTQNTWRDNYKKLTIAAKNAGKGDDLQLWDFDFRPQTMLQLEASAWATIYAMTTGLYTGKKLSDFINPIKTDFINARRIINAQDRAKEIADYADKFLSALK